MRDGISDPVLVAYAYSVAFHMTGSSIFTRSEANTMRTRYAIFPLVLLAWSPAVADHYAGGTITTRCTGNNVHEVTLQLFRNCSGVELIPQTLHFSNSCGVQFTQTGLTPVSVQDASSLCPDDLPNSSCNGGSLLGFELATFRIPVYLSPCATWTISWNICCRNTSLNVTGTPGLYIETTVHNLNGACNEAPTFVNDKVPMVCLNQPVSYDASAVENDGDQLSYELISARFASPAPLPVEYASGHSGTVPFTGMAIDPQSGEITFTPTLTGAIIVVIKVTESGNSGQVKGTVMRDMLFVATACSNTPPTASSGTFTSATGSGSIAGERALEVCGAQAYCASITISDPNIDQVLSVNSSIQNALPGATLTVHGTNPLEVEVCSEGTPLGAYSFWITAVDNGCPVVATRTFHYTVVVNESPDAGSSTSMSVCENAPWVDLFDHLGDTPSQGGQWIDPQGNGTNGVFVPGESLPGIHTYTVGTGTCEASATVSIVLQPASDPECLTAGIIGTRHSVLSITQDATHPHRFWLTTPHMHASMRILSTDGRLLTDGRFLASGTSPTALDLPTTHHGLAVIQLQDEATGARYVLRAVVP